MRDYNYSLKWAHYKVIKREIKAPNIREEAVFDGLDGIIAIHRRANCQQFVKFNCPISISTTIYARIAKFARVVAPEKATARAGDENGKNSYSFMRFPTSRLRLPIPSARANLVYSISLVASERTDKTIKCYCHFIVAVDYEISTTYLYRMASRGSDTSRAPYSANSTRRCLIQFRGIDAVWLFNCDRVYHSLNLRHFYRSHITTYNLPPVDNRRNECR